LPPCQLHGSLSCRHPHQLRGRNSPNCQTDVKPSNCRANALLPTTFHHNGHLKLESSTRPPPSSPRRWRLSRPSKMMRPRRDTTPTVSLLPEQKGQGFTPRKSTYATQRGEGRSMDTSKEEYNVRRCRRHWSIGHMFHHGTSTPCTVVYKAVLATPAAAPPVKPTPLPLLPTIADAGTSRCHRS
jgi:hypothetical protein